jgi:hypothetical protein
MKLSIHQSLLNSAVGVNPPVAQKWPMGTMSIYRAPIDLSDHDFFPID